MKTWFEKPILRVVLFEVCDMMTTWPENPDEAVPGGDTPIIHNP